MNIDNSEPTESHLQSDPSVAITEQKEQQNKLRDAYITARRDIEMTEIEINRAKIMIVDEQGKMKRISMIAEH